MGETLTKLRFLVLFISLRCTNACDHCQYGCSPDWGEDMSFETFEKSSEIAKKNDITKLVFFGGEPFVNSEIIKMLSSALMNGFDVVIATNGYFLNNDRIFKTFCEITCKDINKITIITGNDQYHKKYFDPSHVADKLRSKGYRVTLHDYSNDYIIITEFNEDKANRLTKIRTNISFCWEGKDPSVGVLPNGSWTICPPSLIEFGNITNIDLNELLRFKQNLPLKCEYGCTMCLKDFNGYNKDFAIKYPMLT